MQPRKDIGAEKYTAHSDIHSEKDLNESQQNARDMVLEQRPHSCLWV